jgi:LAO/AO transport system kinase
LLAVTDRRFRSRFTLLGNSRFRLLFLATLGSGLGNWLALVALQIDIYDRTHSGWWVGDLLIANILPAVFIGLLLGPLVDRLSRKGLMIGSDLGRLGVFVLLPFASSASEIILLAVVAGVGNAFFRPAVLAGLPNLVGEHDLPAANSLLQVIESAATAVGPLVGGVLVATSGPHLAYWVNAATFALSAGLVAAIPGRLLQSDRPIGRGRWGDLSEGYRVVRRSQALMCVLVVWSIVMIGSGTVNLAEVFLAKQSYHAGDLGFGVLWAGSGLGLVAGGFAAPSLIERDLGKAYIRFLCVFAIGAGCAAASPDVWIGTLAMALAGFGNGGALVANITLVQRGTPDRVRGRAFTMLMSANYAVLGVAFVAAGPLTNAFGARWAYAGATVVVAIAALVATRFAAGIKLELTAGARHAPETTSEQAPAGEVPAEESPEEDVLVSEVAVEEARREEARVEEAAPAEAVVEETPLAELRVEDAAAPDAPAPEVAGLQAPVPEAPPREAPAAVAPETQNDRPRTAVELAAGVQAGDTRALARAISLLEDGDPTGGELVRLLYGATGHAHAVGVTGSPGVGKSTLISALVGQARARGLTVGVISVDPSSPFTQGALLGDRIRLVDHFLDPDVFIRSMGSRGHGGGLAETTLQTLLVLDAAGKDIVFLETVGTGQSEIGIVSIADTVVLALMPGAGDSVQALKAGIMEIPDVIAINRLDHPQARATAGDVRQALSLGGGQVPPIVLTEALRGEGIVELWEAIDRHRGDLDSDGRFEERRARNLATEILAVASARTRRHLENAVSDDPELLQLLDRVRRRELDPLTAVNGILRKVFHLGDENHSDPR